MVNREEFILELRSKLTRLPKEELEAAVGYYEEYFDEAGEENEQSVIKELGSTSQIAKQIMADYAIKEKEIAPQSTKQGIKSIWIIILAILASPIAVPLAFAGVMLVFAALIVVGALMFTGGVLVFTFFVTGISIFAIMFRVLVIHPMTGVLCLGISILLMGLGLLSVVLMHWLLKELIPIVMTEVTKIFEKTKKGVAK